MKERFSDTCNLVIPNMWNPTTWFELRIPENNTFGWWNGTTEQDSFFTVTLNRWLEVVSQPGHANQDKICPDNFSFTIPVGWSVKKGKRGFASILEKPGCSREPRVFQENIGFSIEPYEFCGFGFPRYIYPQSLSFAGDQTGVGGVGWGWGWDDNVPCTCTHLWKHCAESLE